jgi:hypothetical protein
MFLVDAVPSSTEKDSSSSPPRRQIPTIMRSADPPRRSEYGFTTGSARNGLSDRSRPCLGGRILQRDVVGHSELAARSIFAIARVDSDGAKELSRRSNYSMRAYHRSDTLAQCYAFTFRSVWIAALHAWARPLPKAVAVALQIVPHDSG